MNANAVKVFKKGNGEFRILRYTPGDGVDFHPRGWIPFSGVYDPVEGALERSEPARPSRTRNARVRGCWWTEVLQQEEFVKKARTRGPERRWCDRHRAEHNVNA